MKTDPGQTAFRELCDFTREAEQRHGVPGVALGLVWDNRDFLAGFGVTNIDHPLAVDGDTLFQIGSTTKTVTATAAMRLVEAGKLNLDSPVRRYLPHLRLADEQAAAEVTLRDLFTHMGGWEGDFFQDTGWGDDALARYVEKMADLPQVTPLGTTWHYSNSGFCLAGRVIEAVAARTYEAAVKELVFEPLGLHRSFFFPQDVMLHRFAVGHIAPDGRTTVSRPWPIPRSSNPAGAVTSSARDQLRYARFHLGDGTGADGASVLSAEALTLMQSPLCAGALDAERGIAWQLRKLSGVRLVMHGGATNGQLSAFLMAPERGFAITLLTNAASGGLMHTEVTKWALKRYLDIEDPTPAPIAVTAADLDAVAGLYTSSNVDVELRVTDGDLRMTTTPTPAATRLAEVPPRPAIFRIALCGPDRFVALDGAAKDAQGEFLRGEAGEIAWLRFGGRIRRRV